MREKEVKLSPFVNNVTLYIENLNSSTKRTARIIKFTDIPGDKINIQNQLHFYILIAIKKKLRTPFTILSKRVKYVEKNLTKKVKNPYTENC